MPSPQHDNLDRINKLRHKMVECWAVLSKDSPGFGDAESALSPLHHKTDWNAQLKELSAQIDTHIDTGEPNLECLTERPRHLLLHALDQRLHGGSAGETIRGDLHPPIRFNVDRETWWLIIRPNALGGTIFQKQPRHLFNYLRHHIIVPERTHNGYMVNVLLPRRMLLGNMRALRKTKRKNLNFYLCTFEDAIMPEWTRTIASVFNSPRLTDPENRAICTETFLEEAKALKADVVVLPELSACPTVKERIITWLGEQEHPFLMVVPGSYHLRIPPKVEKPHNRTALLDGLGNEVFHHDKIVPFSSDEFGMEEIHSGNSITLLVTPLGVFSLAICKDFMERDEILKIPWQTLAPDWILAPSMNSNHKGMDEHQNNAKNLNLSTGLRFVAPNQCPCGTFKNTDHGVVIWTAANGRMEGAMITPEARFFSLDIPIGPKKE